MSTVAQSFHLVLHKSVDIGNHGSLLTVLSQLCLQLMAQTICSSQRAELTAQSHTANTNQAQKPIHQSTPRSGIATRSHSSSQNHKLAIQARKSSQSLKSTPQTKRQIKNQSSQLKPNVQANKALDQHTTHNTVLPLSNLATKRSWRHMNIPQRPSETYPGNKLLAAGLIPVLAVALRLCNKVNRRSATPYCHRHVSSLNQGNSNCCCLARASTSKHLPCMNRRDRLNAA